jgi:hypothetical protein
MKYLRYLLIAIGKLLTKGYIYVAIGLVAFGSWIGVAMLVHIVLAYALRRYSTNTVFNYVLKNGLYLPRLTNNKKIQIEDVEHSYKLTSVRGGTGYIKKRNVSAIEYYLTMWLFWIWVDNDCTVDTVAIGYGRDILKGMHFPNAPERFKNRIKKEQDYLETQQLGNSFELGDSRTKVFVPVLSTMWMFRNLAYNYNYMFEECHPDSKMHWYWVNKKRTWHFGYMPKGNKIEGRMVWFTEDIGKMDLRLNTVEGN